MDHGFLNVLPIIVAAVLTIITRETLVSLFAGIILGNIILTNGNIFAAFVKSMTDIMTQVRGNAEVIAFSLLAGALVILLQASGGVNGVVHSLTEKTSVVKNKKHALFLSYLIGLVLFFESFPVKSFLMKVHLYVHQSADSFLSMDGGRLSLV